MDITEKEINRFNSRYVINEETGCWEWTAGHFQLGYGAIGIKDGCLNQQQKLAHRVSYILHKGQIPDNLLVLHSCNNKNCVNPDHLRTGTQKENMQDLLDINGYSRGETHKRSKLNDALVIEIRAKYHSIPDITHLAEQVGCRWKTLYNAYHGISWSHLNKQYPPAPYEFRRAPNGTIKRGIK